MINSKSHRIKTVDGTKSLDFFPEFIANKDGDTLCKTVTIKIEDEEYTFNFLDILMFCYFISDEENKQKLLNVQMKQIKRIPYNVTFKLDEREKSSGIAKRRIELPVDALVIYAAQMEAKKSNFMRRFRK